MEILFFNTSGTVLFSRDDLEEGHWVQEEMSVTATFPFVAGKVITHGMRLGFRDPVTDNIEVFEIRNVQNLEPDHYQQLTAEHIAISELSDEHIDEAEITDKTPTQVLTTALSGTTWSVGTVALSNVSSCDIARGSVWQALQTIQTNWNVECVPRVVVGASGITGKYIDIVPAQGTNSYRGVRLSISKNMHDSTVTYDDTDVLTALYGYGGSVDVAQTGQDDKTETLTFKDVVWSATSSHPAKPSGQKYLEWPEKTAIYGRNGRPRFGFYQNGDIKDANILLQKTWETLKETCDPKIEITGTCTELHRLGYNDAPMRLRDEAIVEIEETGELFHKKIIRLDVDLVDPTATVPTIGDYIPNIVYINRDTEETSSGGGGGGGRGQNNEEYEDSETYTQFIKTNNEIGMVVGRRSGDLYIKAGQIVLAINKSGETGQYESTAWINADHINISATQDVYTLAGDLYHDADGKLVITNAAGLYVKRDQAILGVWDRGNLTGAVMVQQINGQSQVKISGDVIDINGSSIVIDADRIDISGILTTDNIATVIGDIDLLYCQNIWADSLHIRSTYGFSSSGRMNCNGFTINNGSVAEWKSKTVVTGVSVTPTTITRGLSKTFEATDGTTHTGRLVTGYSEGSASVSTATINYVGTSDG